MKKEQKLRVKKKEVESFISDEVLLSRVNNDIREARIYLEWDNKSAES